MRNKQKAWRLGAIVTNKLTVTDKRGLDVPMFPSARLAKAQVGLFGASIRSHERAYPAGWPCKL